jgi:DNA (cytosine-5)-methyltransferase 1
MKHLGDITKISGYTAPIVDCIIGGSPCQDLSVAGKRAGLDGERSGLYIEQVRIVKEMRERDERNGRTGVDVRPRYMVWENVPGAFSSNKGEDFRIVLEELAKVKDKDAVIPMPDGGKWTTAGCIVADGYSIAWRVLDAQFWGVPQRRRRIALVADFGGQSAPEILFVRESVSGHSDESQQTRKATPDHATGGFGADDSIGVDIYNTQLTGDKSATLATNNDQYLFQPVVHCYDIGEARLRTPSEYKDVSPTLSARCGTGGNNTPAVVFKADDGTSSNVTPTIVGDHNNRVTDHTALVVQQCFSKSKRAQSASDNETWVESDTANTLNAFDVGDVRTTEAVVYALDRASFNQGGGKSSVDVREDKAPTLTTTHDGAPSVCYGINGDKAGTLDSSYYKGCGMRQGVEREVVAVPVRTRYIVRRLTPLECERLQGYPDGWTDIGDWVDTNGKKRQTSDAARYKALGNSIALPPWKWVLKRLCACYERDATMASLFDGIGGFPYLWEQLNGKGTCLWASEIEEFPMAVTKVRIGE